MIDLHERYQHQIALKQFGKRAQEKLLRARVLVVGLGGLGCPAIQYLMSVGIGHIGLMDGDVVSLSNLHRQLLFTLQDIGKLKTKCLQKIILSHSPHINVELISDYLTQENAFDSIKHFDIILDCTDNFKSRYLINDACVVLKKTLIYGAVFQYEGQLSVFNVTSNDSNYRDVFPFSTSILETQNCTDAGVFSITTGIIGSLQAAEAIKLITGIGQVQSNQLIIYNALQTKLSSFKFSKRESSSEKFPTTEQEFLEYNYTSYCKQEVIEQEALSAEAFEPLLQSNEVLIIDIRNEHEIPKAEFEHVAIPVNQLAEQLHSIDKNKKIVLFCHTGIRTEYAVELLKEEYHFKNVYHLKGGIIQWLHYKSNKHD